MKKYLFIAALLFLSANAMLAQTNPLKLGYVDSEVILKQLPEAIKAQGDIEALQKKFYDQIDSMTQAFQQDYQNYQKQEATMPEAKKKSSQQQLVKQQQDIEEFKRTKLGQGGEIYKKNEEIFGPIKAKIYQAINEVAKKEGMQFIFDKSGDVLLLYADSSFDVTYLVLDALKKSKK